MKRKKLALMLAMVVTISSALPGETVLAADTPFLADTSAAEYVVSVQKNADLSGILDEDKIISLDDTEIYSVDSKKELKEIITDNSNVTVEPNIVFSASTVETQEPTMAEEEARVAEEERVAAANEKTLSEQKWNIRMIKGYETSDDADSDDVVVAVLDSGIDFISDIPVDKSINLVENEQGITYYMNDMTGHGTGVASIIHEINPDAVIYSVRVLDQNNQATLSRVIEGIRWCMDNNVNIINMSFGASYNSELLEQVISEAKSQGIIFIGAAGNDEDSEVEYPAAYDEVLSVGSVNYEGEIEKSATGSDVVAPGNDIVTQTMLGLYTCSDGTSFAAAHVTGVASVLLSKDTEVPTDFVEGLLEETAVNIGDDSDSEYGLVDLEYAMECYDEYTEQYCENTDNASQIDYIAENDSKILEFTEDEVTYDGLWNSAGHDVLRTMIDEYSVTQAEAEAFKLGAVFSDQVKAGEYGVDDSDFSSGLWHGAMTTNYIACYRYITKVGSMTGSISSITQGVKGLPQAAFNKINSAITDYKIDGLGWADVMGSTLYNNTNGKSNMKKAFIYGIAMHCGTDAYAHDSYRKLSDGTYERIEHTVVNGAPEADNTNVIPDRFTDAKAFAARVISNYKNSSIGGILDFRKADSSGSTYLLGEVYTCACYANQRATSASITKYYISFAYDDPEITVSYTAMPTK